MKIVVATTLTTFAMDNPQVWGSWLKHAEQMQFRAQAYDLDFFAAIEVDARGKDLFKPLVDRLEELGGSYFYFMLDDGRTTVTTPNRQRHLAMGENLCSDYCTEEQADYMLFCAADCAPPPDVLPKLLAVNWAYVGAEIPTYCLSGPEVEGYDFPVQKQLASAACVLIARPLFKRIKWRYDPEGGMTDDPSFQYDAWNLFNVESLVRKDCVAKHYPESIPAIEQRGYDLKVHR